MTVANAPARFASPPHGFAIRVQPGREAVGVQPIGELDLPGSRRLSTAVEELVEAGFADIVIDLSGLVFIDCAGVRVLLAQHAAAFMEAIWVAAEMRAGGAYAHSSLALETAQAAAQRASGTPGPRNAPESD